MIEKADLIEMTTRIVSAYVQNNEIEQDALPKLIGKTWSALSDIAGDDVAGKRLGLEPPVPIEDSVTSDHIICLEDGKPFKSLKRHLRTHYDLSPDEYRARWGLASDYPMVAPTYAKQRSEFAKKIGLGLKRRKKTRKRAKK